MHGGIRFAQEDEVDEREQRCQSKEDDAQTVQDELHIGDLQELGVWVQENKGSRAGCGGGCSEGPRPDRRVTASCLRTHRTCDIHQTSASRPAAGQEHTGVHISLTLCEGGGGQSPVGSPLGRRTMAATEDATAAPMAQDDAQTSPKVSIPEAH